jgi:hypothetical protein
MRKALIITGAALLAVALAAPASSATTSAASTRGAIQTTVAMTEEDPPRMDCSIPCVSYQVRTANGWGEIKGTDTRYQDGPTAGCDRCKLEAIRASSTVGLGYRVRAQNGWGVWRSWPEAAGCSGCVIQAIQLGQTTNTNLVEYRVFTDGGPGEWRSAITEQVAGCVGCTVHYIQMRIS